MKLREEYEETVKSGMFWEFFPTWTGKWKEDRLNWLKHKKVITDTTPMDITLKYILDNQTKEESQEEWDRTKEFDLIGPTVTEFLSWQNLPSNISTKEYVYEAMYNPCVHDSSYSTISIHKTEAGAQKAIENHKLEIKKKFDDIYNNPSCPIETIVDIEWDEFQSWHVNKTELLD